MRRHIRRGIAIGISGLISLVATASVAAENPPLPDVCENYNTGEINKPAGFPSYHSLLQESWTHRRPLNPATDLDVGGPSADFVTLKDAFAAAKSGDTIVVHALTPAEASANNTIGLGNKYFADNNPLHIYFVADSTPDGKIHIGPGPTAYSGGVMGITNASNIVIDGMNNLTVYAPAQNVGVWVGNEKYNPDDLTNVRNLVLKNFKIDAGYYGPGTDGAKWGLSGAGTTNVAICNLDIRNTGEEHGIYWRATDKNFEVVASTIDNTGRTAIQKRSSGIGSETSVDIFADNVLSNTCDGGILTVDDSSGEVYVHGNSMEKMRQGLTFHDTSDKDGDKPYANPDHSKAQYYVYDNKIHMGTPPIHTTQWGIQFCGNLSKPLILNQGGQNVHFMNNVVLQTAGQAMLEKEPNAGTTYYCPVPPGWTDPGKCPAPPGFYFDANEWHPASPGGELTFPVQIVESDKNVFGMGIPGQPLSEQQAGFAQWGYQTLTQWVGLTVAQWKTPNLVVNGVDVHKPIAYDLNSQFVFGYDNVMALVDEYFSSDPPSEENSTAIIVRVDEQLAPISGTVAAIEGTTLTDNPAMFANLSPGAHLTYVTDLPDKQELVSACAYPIGGTECTVPTTFVPAPVCKDGYCKGPIATAAGKVTKIFVKYTSAPATGDVVITRVNASLTSLMEGTVATVNPLPASTQNPAVFAALPPDVYPASVTDLPGYIETAGVCVYAMGQAPCVVKNFVSLKTCDGTICKGAFAVGEGAVTHIAVKYTPRRQQKN